MSLIYSPSGKAREYSPLALNVYSQCDHGCTYCYCCNMMKAYGRAWDGAVTPRELKGLEREAKKANKQILLSFVGDPYCIAERQFRNTRFALRVLKDNECSVAILTKGGIRCLDDIETFSLWPDGRIKVGATMTFVSEALSAKYEPGAATPKQRIQMLRVLSNSGIKTWASIEPVIDAAESLAAIEATIKHCDAYKVGKLNHSKTNVDWAKFGKDAVDLIRSHGKGLYVKKDLQPFFPCGYLTQQETDMDALALPERPTPNVLHFDC